jgi:hypothetical protein
VPRQHRPTHAQLGAAALELERRAQRPFYEIHALRKWDGKFAPNVMGYFEQPDIPYFWALARAYTLNRK